MSTLRPAARVTRISASPSALASQRARELKAQGEDDVILLGDLNVDEKHLGQLAQVPNIAWVIAGVPTNVRRTKTYDNILFDRVSTSEFVGRGGVYDFQRQFRLTAEQALQISDHFPVWAVFSTQERQSKVAFRDEARASR